MDRYQRLGWLMFLLSGLFFLVLGIRDQEWLTIAGAMVWMIGCGLFLAGDRYSSPRHPE